MAQTNEVLAGVAEVDITPPIGYPMAGHFYKVESEGIHDPLKAKAIVLEHGDQRFSWVFCDVVSIPPAVSSAVQVKSSNEHGNSNPTMVSATHSHTGPLFSDVRFDIFNAETINQPGQDPHPPVEYQQFLIDSILKALKDAKTQLAPTVLSFATAERYDLSYNRRYQLRDGSVESIPPPRPEEIMRPAGPIDPEVTALLITNPSTERVIGGLTIFACHADTMGGTQFSADFPYFIEKVLRCEHGPDMVSTFAAGCSGDINHVRIHAAEQPRKGIEVSERIGRALGDTVLASRSDATEISQPSFAFRSRLVSLPLQTTSIKEYLDAMAAIQPMLREGNARFFDIVKAFKAIDLHQRTRSWTTAVQAFRLDENTALVGLPGEVFADIGMAIRSESPFPRTMVTQLANDRAGYIPTSRAFDEGSYEVINSRIEPGCGEQLAATAINLLQDLRAAPSN